MARWHIDHMDNQFNVFQTVLPQNLHFTKRHRAVGTIEYDLSLSATDPLTNQPIISRNFLKPYSTGWRLYRDNTFIMAGWHTSLNGKLRGESLHVAGKDWYDYLDKRHFPFDPTQSALFNNVDAGKPGIVGQWFNVDAILPINHLLKWTVSQADGRPYSIRFAHDTNPIGVTISYGIDIGNTDSILSHIESMASIYPGFDYDVTPARWIRFFVPHKYGIASAPTPIWLFDGTDALFDLEFTNNGIEGTHMLASVNNAPPLSLARLSEMNAQEYHRIDMTRSYETVPNDTGTPLEPIEERMRGDFAFALNPRHEIPFSVNPEEIPGFWTTFDTGLAINIFADLEWHHINSFHQILEMDCFVDNNANEKVDFKIQQIYDEPPDGFVGIDSP